MFLNCEYQRPIHMYIIYAYPYVCTFEYFRDCDLSRK